MITIHNISKIYRTKKGARVVLDNVTHTFPPGLNTGILGRNGVGKSTLLSIIGGSEVPDAGRVERTTRVSWPIGFAGGFNAAISGRENLRFMCRLYDKSYSEVNRFVEDFAELGEYMDMPVATYSSGMRAKLAFGASMSFNFDYYLIDEVTAVGDSVFKQKSQAYFNKRRSEATLLVVSHSMTTIKELCDHMLVLHEGKLLDFASMDEAEKFYVEVCCGRGK